MNRRSFVRLAVASASTCALAACRRAPEFSCEAAPGLTPAESAARVALGYVDRGPDVARVCENCNHFVSAGDARCGTCRIVRGPIHPKGSCRVWTARR